MSDGNTNSAKIHFANRILDGNFKNATVEQIQSLATFFEVSPLYLLNESYNEEGVKVKAGNIPLLGLISAGAFRSTDATYPEDYVSVPHINDPENYIALTVDGGSMEPTLNRGDIIVVKKMQDANIIMNSTIVVAYDNDDNAGTVKRLYHRSPTLIELIPDNPLFKRISLERGATNASVYGVVKYVIKSVQNA